MAKETLSIKQALKIIEDYHNILRSTSAMISEKSTEFVDHVSLIWEDKNAVDLFKLHKDNMENYIEELQNNGIIFAETVKNIADAYAQTGGISERLNYSPIKLDKNIDVSKIKEHFTNGENEDDFGFVNPETGPVDVMVYWDDLAIFLFKKSVETADRIKSINAFGNEEIQINLANSANQAIKIVNNHINDFRKTVDEHIAKSAADYSKVAAEAVGAAAVEGAEDVSSHSNDWSNDANFSYFNQNGEWNDYRYSSGGANTMAKSGCAPTSMAMVMASLGFDVDPNVAADWSADHGYHVRSGTFEKFFTAYAQEMGIENRVLGKDKSAITSALSNNELVILHVGPGKYHDFTDYGHFIVARAYDPETNQILIADPNKEKNNTWHDLDRVASQLKGDEASWAFSV